MAGANSKKNKDKVAVRILIGCSVFIIALFVMYGYASRQLNLIDADTLCRNDTPLVDHTVILIDRTDPLQGHIADTIFREINEIKDALPKYAMLSIYEINAESAEFMAPEFCLCNPGDGDDANFLYQAPKMIQQRWEKQFGAPLSAALDSLKMVAVAETSPILEAIGVVGDLPKFREATNVRRIVIYSDMLQNMKWYSQYGAGKGLKPPALQLREIIPDLNGVDILVRYIERSRYSRVQGSEHKALWTEILMGLGAKSVEIQRVVG